MARTTTKRKLNLATAEQADGALPPIRSAYQLMGIQDDKYREKTFASYQARLRKMDLAELQDHAYEMAVPPSPAAHVMIDRLEDKYLHQNPEQRQLVNEQRARENGRTMTIKEQAERVMARSR